MIPGRGAVPDDRAHPRVVAQQPFQALARKLGASATPRGSADLSRGRPPMMDQNGFGACTAHAAARALFTRYAVLGRPLPWVPSPLDIWSRSLLLETSPVPTPAQLAALNSGVMSVSAMIAIGTGIRAMGAQAPGRFSDVVAGPVSPGLDQLTADALAPQVGEYRIDETSSDWPTLAAIALDNEIPVYVGLNVGPAYDAWTPTMAPIDADEAPSPQNGGHAVVLDKYETTSTGDLVFTSPGSYGTGYADDGVWLFTARGLQARAFDVYPFEVG